MVARFRNVAHPLWAVAFAGTLFLMFQNCSPFAATPLSERTIASSSESDPSDSGTNPPRQPSTPEPSAPTLGPGYDIFIIAGQSNSVGYGGGTFADQQATAAVNARIEQIGRYGSSNLIAVPSTDFLQHWSTQNAVGQPTGGIGFAMAFARRYVQSRLAPNRKVLLVPGGLGGSPSFLWDDVIGTWTNPYDDTGDNTLLLDDLMARVRAALRQPGENRIMGLLWHQGESDTLCMEPGAWCEALTPNAATYVNRLSRIFDRVRTSSPKSFPVIVGKFSPIWNGGGSPTLAGAALTAALNRKDSMETALMQISNVVSNSACVETTGLKVNADVIPGNQDILHFSAQSQIELGARYFETYMRMSSDP